MENKESLLSELQLSESEIKIYDESSKSFILSNLN